MQFRIAKRRKSSLEEPIIPTKKRLNLKYHVGGLTRKFFRHIFEHKAIKKLLGANIAFMLVASSFVPTLASNEPKVLGINVIKAEIPLTTVVSMQNPVETIKITQGYKFFHPGLDLDGDTGDKINAIKAGKVESAESESFGYGKHVIVDHGENMKTLYAHLSEIKVKKGDVVDTNTVVGLMGSTGHSTGSHLHFEVRQNGLPINPLSILPK